MGKKKGLKEGWIVPAGEKLALVFGAGSVQAMNTFVGTFLAIYLLMVGIDARIAAVVLLFIKAWDAINDVLFGFLVDKYRFKEGKTSFTRWLFGGRYMPWFRLLFLIIPVGTVIMFTINTSLPLWLRVTQYVLGYVMFDAGCTVSGAYGLLPLSMTNNYDERNFVLSWAGLGQGICSLPVVFLGTAFIAGSFGYAGSAVVFSILGLVLAIIPALTVKERNVTAYDEAKMNDYSVKDMLMTFKTMPELIFLMLGSLFWGLFYTTGYGLFVSYYIFHNANISIITTLVSAVPSIIIIPFLPPLFKKIDKIVVARIACIIFAVVGVMIYALGASFFQNNLPVFFLMSFLQGTSYVLTMFATAQLMPDLAEVVRYRTGTDVAGTVSATYSFVTKLVNSLVTSVSLLILSAYGWVAVEADSFEKLAELNAQGIGLQTGNALEGLWNVSYLFPIIGFTAAALMFFFVKVKRRDIAIYMKVNSGGMSKEDGEAMLLKGEGVTNVNT
jgi:Na+/melibiose symporter-like transporter